MDNFWCIVMSLGLLFGTEKTFGSIYSVQNLSTLYHKNLKSMIAMINKNIEPCDNFFNHACGYDEQKSAIYENNYARNSNEGVPPMLYNHENRFMFFESQYENFTTGPGKMLSQIYAQCKKLRRSSLFKAPEKLWQYIVHEVPLLASQTDDFLHGWPYLHFQWTEVKARGVHFDWPKLAGELVAYGIVDEIFIKIFFAENTIYVTPPEEVMNCGSLVEIKESLLPLMKGRSEQIVEIISRELFLFCQELNIDEDRVYSNDTDLLIGKEFFNYVQAFKRRLNITDQDISKARVIAEDQAYYNVSEAKLQIFCNSDERIVYNFLLWHAYRNLKTALDDCFLLTDEFEELLLTEYWQWHVFQKYFRRDVALTAYNFHTNRFQRKHKSVFRSMNWSAFLEINNECKDFDLARIITYYANEWLDPSKILTIYNHSFEWLNGSFYRNLLQMRCLKRRSAFIQPYHDFDDFNHPHNFLRQFLNFSILFVAEPRFHYFATLGFDLWHNSELLHTTDGYYTAVDCLQRQSSRWYLDYEDTANDSLGVSEMYRFLRDDEVLLLFNFYQTFVATYRDYQFWLQGESFAFVENTILKRFDLDNLRIVFYAVAQQYCGRNNEHFGNLINRSYMNMPQFQVAFNCSVEALMNPEHKCMINNCEVD